MDLHFDELQQMLRRTARDLFQREWPITVAEEVFREAGHSPTLWKKMAELGWVGLILPEEYEGGGGSLLDLAALCEEFGRAAAPYTFYSTVTAALAILHTGTEEQKRRLLPRVADGSVLLSLALTEPEASYDPVYLTTKAIPDGVDWVINGTKLFVQGAEHADYLVVVARTEGGAEPAVSAFVVPARALGVTITPLTTFGGDRQSEVVLTNVRVPRTDLLGAAGQAWPGIARALQSQTALQLADTAGLGQFVLDTTVDYVRGRTQFGQLIGSFQAVHHHCANMVIDLDGGRLLAYEAISKLSKGLPAECELSMAKAFLTESMSKLTMLAHRLHGGIGYVTEHGLYMYSSRAKAAEQTLGTPFEHLELVARQLGL